MGRYLSPEGVLIQDGNGTTLADVVSHEGENSLVVVIGHTETFKIHLETGDLTASQGFMLVDLSDTTNWPHTNTHHVALDWMSVHINPSTAFRGDVDVGFLVDVDADNGDFYTVQGWNFPGQGTPINLFFPYGSHRIDLEPSELFGPVESDDTTWRTGVNLDGPDGATSYPSGTGDMVLKVTRSAGNVNVNLSFGYTTHSS